MRELIYYVAASIDGRIADADGGTDRFSTDPDLLGALAQEFPESFPAHLRGPLGAELDTERARWSTVVMGRRTYEPALAVGITSPYAPLEEIVVSRTLPPSMEAGAPRIVDDPVAAVRALKDDGSGGIWLCGGGELAAALADEIDRLIVKINPIVLGEGRPLVADAPLEGRWRLEDVRRLPGDVVLVEYVRER